MAGAAILFLLVLMIVLGIGFISLIIGIILDLTWRSGVKKGKPVHTAHKVFAVLTSAAGMIMFVLPVVGWLAVMAVGSAVQKMEYRSIENKIHVNDEDWREDGFDYDGMHLVPVEHLFKRVDTEETEPLGALVISEENYYYFYPVENERDFPLFAVPESGGKLYCDAGEKAAVEKYYFEDADVRLEAVRYGGEEPEYIPVNFDRSILHEIRAYYKTRSDDIDVPYEDVDLYFSLREISKDDCYTETTSFLECDGMIALSHSSSYGHDKGISLTPEHEAYVRAVLEKQTDFLN